MAATHCHAAISFGLNRVRPAAIAANGTMEVCAAKDCQAGPSARRRLASIDTVPASAVTAREPKKMNEARSPLAIRCTTAHNPTPMRNGWRVTRTMPSGGRATRPSSPTIVGFDVVNPVTARSKARSRACDPAAMLINHALAALFEKFTLLRRQKVDHEFEWPTQSDAFRRDHDRPFKEDRMRFERIEQCVVGESIILKGK